MTLPQARTVSVAAERLARWKTNFAARHPGELVVREARYEASDGSWFEVGSVFDTSPNVVTDDVPAFVPAPQDWGILLVRKGGFAVARMQGSGMVTSKVGRRHVQGRTKAGGQSQQRFARRRGNQARQAYEACSDHAAHHLANLSGPVITGGDDSAVREVLADVRLRVLQAGPHFGDVVEPRRDTLEAVVARCLAWQVTVLDTTL